MLGEAGQGLSKGRARAGQGRAKTGQVQGCEGAVEGSVRVWRARKRKPDNPDLQSLFCSNSFFSDFPCCFLFLCAFFLFPKIVAY